MKRWFELNIGSEKIAFTDFSRARNYGAKNSKGIGFSIKIYYGYGAERELLKVYKYKPRFN